MSHKKTHQQFVGEMNEVNPNIEITGEYQTAMVKVPCRCLVCLHEWSVRPNALLDGSGCPMCGRKRAANKNSLSRKGVERVDLRKTHQQFVEQLKDVNPTIEITGEYVKDYVHIACRCLKCGHVWSAQPSNLLQGYGCMPCSGNTKKTTQQFIEQLKEINPNIEVKGEYKTAQTKILCHCEICDHEWSTRPIVLLLGTGCPICNTSKGEKKIIRLLQARGWKFKEQRTFKTCKSPITNYPFRFDFHISDFNILIEHNGQQHYEPVKWSSGVTDVQARQDLLRRQWYEPGGVLDDLKRLYL